MKLWNDYEGKVLAERYTLGLLIRPEGRSALFTFTAGPGSPAIIRITESLNDEGEMLATWRRLAELKNENLLTITDFGETVFEGTPLTYAVLEPTDADLDGLLGNRALTQPEALQVASSLASALATLHAADLMHEHIDPNNVFAVGETVKLRADCVRRLVVDNEFVTAEDRARMVKQDVHDLGVLLLRTLTLQKTLRPGLALPGPFNQIVPRAIDGTWGLPEITRVLTPAAPAASVPPPPARAAVPQAISPAAAKAPATTPAVVAPATVPIATSPAAVAAGLASPGVGSASAVQADLPYSEPEAAVATESHTVVADNPLLYQRRVQAPTLTSTTRLPKWAPLAIAAALLVALVLFVVHGSSSAKPQSSVVRTPAVQAHQQPVSAAPVTTAARPVNPEPAAATPVASTTQVQPGWYVIAYTFNHEEQALKRAAAIVRRYPGLHPQVIAPSGNAYLVALGGAMSRNEAESIRNHARRAGMPRDTFVRNYGS